jgi:signal transduction histidine kinase
VILAGKKAGSSCLFLIILLYTKEFTHFGRTKIKPLRFLQILFIVLIATGCMNSSDTKPVSTDIPTSSDFQKGESLFNLGTKKDSAFYYFTNVTETSKDSLLVAMAYTYLAMMQQDVGDHLGSQESALEGLRHVNEKNPNHYYCLSSIYNEMGVSSVGLKNYNAAIEYYDLAIKFQQDEAYKTIFQNNKAVAYREKGEYRKAIQILESTIELQRSNKLDYARVLSNLASVKWLADPSFYPIPQFLFALEIRMREKNDIGLAASYNHLSDYYLSHNRDSALFYARTMYRLAKRINSSDEKLDVLPKLISLAPSAESKAYFNQYQYLNDSILTARNKAKNQFALIKYQSEKNKAENLLLQQDNAQKELKILRQRIWIYSIMALVVLIIIFVYWWYRKKKQQMEWKSQAVIRENHLKTSQKVHDIVANGLYRIMNEIEHKEDIEKEVLLNKIEQLYEHSRDISYEPVGYKADAEKRINEILTSFATPQIKVSVVGNKKIIWDTITQEAIKELEHILQELMINMVKHSHARYVVIRFDLSEHSLTILYRDDGIGFKPDIKLGNGLKSTETRIRGLGGELTFTAEPTVGASIKITIPITNT